MIAADYLISCLGLFAFGDPPAQSMVHPAGPAAAEIAVLWWVMLGVFTAVFVLVNILLIVALFRGEKPAGTANRDVAQARGMAPPWGRTGFIVAGGVVLPILVLTPLYIYSLVTSSGLTTPKEAFTVRVVGHMWWWEVRYPDLGIVTANEIHIPAGQPIRLELTSADVIHSFWVPRLNGKRDLIPGIENVFSIQADAPGVYRGQCGEYCGTQHANMAFEVIALSPEDFEAWSAARKARQSEPGTPQWVRGREIFLTAGCAQCHAVEGTRAVGNVGPDLTHFGSRRMLGGAMLPNTADHLAQWIADPRRIKPGIKMPRTALDAQDMQALVAYLGSLE